MNGRWLLAIAALYGSSGCTIEAVSGADDARPTNECSSEADCGSDQNCNGGMCQPQNGELESLLVVVTPPSDRKTPNFSYTMHVDGVPPSGGEVQLPAVLGA